VVSSSSLTSRSREIYIPEIDIKVDSIAVTAQTKKLKAKWTPELGQDLNAYHNLDAEVELTAFSLSKLLLRLIVRSLLTLLTVQLLLPTTGHVHPVCLLTRRLVLKLVLALLLPTSPVL
jgi:hypothetical protein